jgi:succinate dehydrogenase / fumarate reductase membrane anchor subunit
MVEFMRSPWHATLMLLTVFCAFYHGMLGLIVIIEDYVQHHTMKHILVFGLKMYAALGSVLASVSILKLTFGG